MIEPADDREREAYRKAAPLDPGEITTEERYRLALQRIRDVEGKVCAEFEVCDHPACNSSYAAWAIADEALNDRKDQEQK